MKERKGVKRGGGSGGREGVKWVVGREGKKEEGKEEIEVRGRGCKSCI